ncbi:hypothetical protein HYFRA_00006693 [Hymenoscyphus fraxineus]|uniref:Carboxylic ester hydrolase n=1 Tax=Hymenoscyphus fraxineus TaxID=746836 RepID=A0A9N9KU87_9HELO|nr:hypothetical protein HYFRA_00006693 [Hymenoscyphus fraxineus]
MPPESQRRLIHIVLLVAVCLVTFWILDNGPHQVNIHPVMTATSRPQVVLRQGKIIGSKLVESHGGLSHTLDQFLGIPYALSTDGERRFKPAVPVPESELEFDASKYGQRCPAGEKDSTPMGEDCLNLNLFRPATRPKDGKLPVLVYIHGGSFNFGAGNARQISSMVAWSTRPMIGISFNYRLGALGFLSSKVAAAEGVLNLGLKDQDLLLRWVRENVHAFGGDEGDVTIMGSSAGAHSVGHHLLHNPDEPPLFHKAIIESGAATARTVLPYDNPLLEQQFHDFLSHLGLQNLPTEKILNSLRTLPYTLIKSASEQIYAQYASSLRWPWQPVIEGKGGIITQAPIQAWKSGKWHQVPIMTGFNTNEGAIFIDPGISTSDQFTKFFRVLLPNLSTEDLRILNEIYPDPTTDPSSPYVETRKELGRQFFRMEQAYGHFAYISPVRQTAHFAASSGSPVWLYQFAATSRREGGADHCDHNNFVTYNKELREFSPSIREISAKMHSYWTSFVTTGDPNAEEGLWKERATWPRFGVGDAAEGKWGKIAVFGEGNDEIAGGGERGVAVKIVEDGWVRGECGFWEGRTELFES